MNSSGIPHHKLPIGKSNHVRGTFKGPVWKARQFDKLSIRVEDLHLVLKSRGDDETSVLKLTKTNRPVEVCILHTFFDGVYSREWGRVGGKPGQLRRARW